MLSDQDTQTIGQVYVAMQLGPQGEEQMLGLFTEDGVLVEPFTGTPREHHGQAAIRECYQQMMATPRPPDFKIVLDRIDTQDGQVSAEWTCTASVMPVPLKGRDEYVLRDGKIAKLEIRLLGGPQ